MKVYSVKESEFFPDGFARIYTKQEALDRGMFFLPHDRWRDAKEGEYAETVDGYVTPVIKRNDNNPSSCYLKTPTGCFHTSPDRNPHFDTEEFFNRNSFSRGTRWGGNGKLTSHQDQVVDIFLVNGFDLERALKAVYGNTRYNWGSTAAEVATSDKFKRAIVGKVADIIKAQNLDINLEKILIKLDEALDSTDGDKKNFRSILQMAARSLGEDFLEEKKYLAPKSKRIGLFAEAEDAEYDDKTDSMKLVKGPVKEEKTA